MLKRLRARQEWQFFAVLPKADPALAAVWWALIILNGALPAVFAVAIGLTVNAVEESKPVATPLALTGAAFVLMLIVTPIQTAVSMNLGNKVSAWLNDALIRDCVVPPGIGHLEDPALASDLTTAREFDRAMTGPPMYLNVEFIGTSLVSLISGIASALVLVGFAWWAPVVLALAWGSTHWLLRESGIWKDRNTSEVRSAQRHADYAYRLAVDPQPAKELRLFGLAGWTVERFIARRKQLFELQYRATRLREKSVMWCLIIVLVANVAVFGALGWYRRLRKTAAGWACRVRASSAWRQLDRLRRSQLGIGRGIGSSRGGSSARTGNGTVGPAGDRAWVRRQQAESGDRLPSAQVQLPG